MPERGQQGTNARGSDTEPNTKSSDGSGVSRRTFVQAAGASAGAVGLAGCLYGNGDGGDGVVIGFDPDAEQAVGEEIKQLFYDNGLDGDIEIEFRPGDSDTGDRRDNYVSLLQAGEAEPDILLMDNGWVNVFIQRGHIANLSDELTDEELSRIENEYFGPFTDTARDPETDNLYAVPLFPDYPSMIYRKDYAREAGYDDDDFDEWATEPMTWQEWADVTEEIVDASDAEFGLATQWDNYEGTACCTWNEVMSSFGGAYFGGRDNLFGPVGDRPVTVDEPEFIEGLSMMYTFVAEEEDEYTHDDYPTGLATTSITSWRELDAHSAMAGGNAVMQRNWPFAIVDSITSDDYDLEVDDVGTMPIPYAVSEADAAQPGTGGTTSALGGWHLCLNPNSERKAEALEVLRTAMEDDVNLGLFDLWGWIPPKPGLFEAEEAESLEPIGNYLDTLQVAGENAMARPVTQQWPSQSSSISEQVNQAVAGDKPPAEAAADLQESLEGTESS